MWSNHGGCWGWSLVLISDSLCGFLHTVEAVGNVRQLLIVGDVPHFANYVFVVD